MTIEQFIKLSPIHRGFVTEALIKYCTEVLEKETEVKEAMKDHFINADAWIQCAKDGMKL